MAPKPARRTGAAAAAAAVTNAQLTKLRQRYDSEAAAEARKVTQKQVAEAAAAQSAMAQAAEAEAMKKQREWIMQVLRKAAAGADLDALLAASAGEYGLVVPTAVGVVAFGGKVSVKSCLHSRRLIMRQNASSRLKFTDPSDAGRDLRGLRTRHEVKQ